MPANKKKFNISLIIEKTLVCKSYREVSKPNIGVGVKYRKKFEYTFCTKYHKDLVCLLNTKSVFIFLLGERQVQYILYI